MATKAQLLVSALLTSTSKVFYDRPETLTSGEIAKELELRETTDQMLAVARMKIIANLFSDNPKKLNPFE